VITTVDIDMTDLSVTEFDLDGIEVTTLPDDQAVQFTIDDSALFVDFEYSMREESWPFVSASGHGTFSATGISGVIVGSVELDRDCGVLTIIVGELNFNYGDITITLEGGEVFADIMNAAIKLLESMFTDTLNVLIGDWFQTAINTYVTSVFPYKQNDQIAINRTDIFMDIRETAWPVILDGYIAMFFTGYSYPKSVGNGYDQRPFTDASAMPEIVTSADLQMIADQSCLGSVLSSMQYMDMLKGYIDPSTVTSPQLQSLLNTSTVAALCPGIYDEYPDQAISLSLSADPMPEFQVMPSAAFLNVTGTIDVRLA
ncbi:hypothetical protein KIPB_009108, partial [Kipferlia bialata]